MLCSYGIEVQAILQSHLAQIVQTQPYDTGNFHLKPARQQVSDRVKVQVDFGRVHKCEHGSNYLKQKNYVKTLNNIVLK